LKEADSDGSSTRRLIVAGAPAESRLDAFLASQLPDLSRSRITQLIATGRILVNGEPARKSAKPVDGDVIEVSIPAPAPSHIAPEAIPLSVVFEDADLAVIDKPAGLVVHPAPGHRSGTLVNALLHHVQDLSGIGGVKRPGIVHRLDRDTSGLLLVAKNDDAHRALSAALKKREIRRTYLAAVWGHLTSDDMRIDAPIGRAHNDRKRMAVIDTGRPAATRIRRLERWRSADFVTAELETGRTHQIRVHLASIGHPVVGDATYGPGGARGFSGPARRWAEDLERRVPRQFLHAAELRLKHPRTGEPLVFESLLPEDLAAASEWARHAAGG
jgi:23S rRNA pseudouridine1911/1915/1917 synthase